MARSRAHTAPPGGAEASHGCARGWPNAPAGLSASARRRIRSRILLAVLGATTLTACELPTDAPDWRTTWVVPADSTVMAVADLLPSSVTVTPDGGAFQLALDGVTFARSLGQICSACSTMDGATVPKPAFSATFGSAIALPSEVVSADLESGSVAIQLTNGFGFDPIRPGGSARGRIQVTVTSGATTLADLVLDGDTESFAPNAIRDLTLILSPATLTDSVHVTVLLDSPEGDPVTIDASQSFGVAATPGALRVSEARVRVQDRSVSVDPVEVDLEDIDEGMIDRVRGGAFLLDIVNPFTVGGELTLSVGPAGQKVIKTLSIAPDTTRPRIEFTAEELRSLLGRPGVVLEGTGTVSGTGGAVVTVTPTQALVMKSKLELTLGTKED